uniref:Uncharacterized protein n=1 Tax=Oryza barthii TaxID=65489 RepID=A0A0D3FV43_9ORYZ
MEPTKWTIKEINKNHKRGKDFHVPKETTDKGSNDDDMRSIDETDISTLNMDQLSQIERLLEDELRGTRARKVQGKPAIVEVEKGSMEIPIESGQEKEQIGGEAVVEQRSRTTPLDLNMPCWDAGPLQ